MTQGKKRDAKAEPKGKKTPAKKAIKDLPAGRKGDDLKGGLLPAV